jgi:DNA-binding transcriptional ArsR family regulator
MYYTHRLINHIVKSMPDPLSLTFAALSDPTRRALLARLSDGEANVSDLAKPFLKTMSLPAVTKHLKVLERAGLVSKGRNAQWRPCRLNREPLRDAIDWMEHHRVAAEEQLDRLGAYLKSKSQGTRHVRKK